MELNKIFNFYIFCCSISGCVWKKEGIKFNNRIYEYDEFKFQKNKEASLEEAYINYKNDSIFMLEDFSKSCKIEWLVGVLSKEKEVLSLSNVCKSTTLIYNLRSKIESRYYSPLIKDSIFKFKIRLSTNAHANKEVFRELFFSKNKGIISIIKKDTIELPPFY